MKTFVLAMLVSALLIGAYAEFSQQNQMDALVDMGLMYAQNALQFDKECFDYVKKGYDMAMKIYNAIANGETNDLFSIITQVIPLINNIKTHCFSG